MHDWMFAYIFNLYDLLVLTVTTLSVLLIIPLLLKRDKQISDLLLSAFMFSQGASSLITVLLFNEELSPRISALLMPFQFVPLIVIYAIQGFFLLWYCQSLLGEKIQIKTNSTWVIFTLFIISITLESYGIYTLQFPSEYPNWCWVPVLTSCYLGIKALHKLIKHDKKIRQNYSNIDKVRLNWLLYSSLGFVCVWVLVLTSTFLGLLGFVEIAIQIGTFSNIPPLILLSCMVIYSQKTEINGQLFDPEKSIKNQVSADKKPHISHQNREKIEDLMTRVKIYQDPELRLEGLADCMDLSTRSVSTLLNGHYQKNFYDFINYYRVKDAELQLKNPDNINKTVQRVFEDAGFNSKTTFNTLFKKLTGHTPTEYRRQNELA